MSATATAIGAASAAERTSRRFATALSSADLDGAVACLTRDACLVTPDSTAVRGRESIRAVLVQLLASRAEIHVHSSTVLDAGAVALASEHWTLRSAGPEGSVCAQELRPSLVLRLLEGIWKLAVVVPWSAVAPRV